MLLDVTDPEKDVLIALLVDSIERSLPSPQTDLLHSLLPKIGADTASAPTDPAAPLDEAVLTALSELRRDGQPDVLSMVLALFQQSAPAVLNELVAAAASDDTVLLLGASHKLRGISANVGARLLASRCSQLEAAARLGSVPENAGTQIEGISREYEPSKQL